MKKSPLAILSQKLISIPKFGSGIGLHRIRYFCSDIFQSKWSEQIDPINIVGSNGKGSTAAMVAGILRELGISSGMFTSPHLFEFTERIVVDGKKIRVAELETTYQHFLKKQHLFNDSFPDEQIGAFEVFTYLAIQHFFNKKVETAIMEAGIGGRYDPTRAFSGNFVALTSLDLEHTQLLGNSLELIAYDKMDLAKTGATIILGKADDKLLKRLEAYAKLKGIKLIPIQHHTEVEQVDFVNDRMILDIKIDGLAFKNLKSNLLGYHQVNNLLIAVLLLKKWLEKNRPSISIQQFQSAVYEALQKVKWMGRLEKIQESPPVYIDVGHTPAAMDQLTRSFEQLKEAPCLVITGVSYNKDISGIVPKLTAMAEAVICTAAYHKGAKAADIYEVAKEYFDRKDQLFQMETIEDAVDFGIAYAKKHRMSILIAGGLFLAIEGYHYLKGEDIEDLQFF